MIRYILKYIYNIKKGIWVVSECVCFLFKNGINYTQLNWLVLPNKLKNVSLYYFSLVLPFPVNQVKYIL